MTENKRPIWGRFRLRTIFVILTAICVWLAWQLSLVHNRRQLVREMRSNPAFTIITAEAAERQAQPPAANKNGKLGRISWFRRLLGDVPIDQIVYSPYEQGFSKAKLDRLQSAFAEATVVQEMPPEPCHPGCFPHGTLVETPTGPRAIETIQPGERVLVVSPDATVQSRHVESVFRTSNWLWRISTDHGEYHTTETQPLCLTLEKTIAAGKLQPGDTILARQDDRLVRLTVTRVVPTGFARPVVNLVLGDPRYFIAGGLLARSKPPLTASILD